jgi:hypothetical protein
MGMRRTYSDPDPHGDLDDRKIVKSFIFELFGGLIV